MTNRWLRGLLLVLPILCAASRRGDAQELPAFDHQLELFTRLAIEGKVAEAEVFLREPAFLRAVAGNLHVLDLVLALSPQLDLCDARGATALFYAAAGRTEVVRRLIQRGADVDLPDQTGKSPLMVAVLMNHPDTVGLLLAAGADVNHRDHVGATALFYAAEAGLFEMAEQLVKGGADSQLSDNRGLTPRQVGEAKSFPKIVDLFLRK
jgi:ankyrin repeat protein